MSIDAFTSTYREATLHLCWVLFISGTATNCIAVSCVAALTSDWDILRYLQACQSTLECGIHVFSFFICSDPYLKKNTKKNTKNLLV